MTTYHQFAFHAAFRPAKYHSNHADLLRERASDFVNPAARITLTYPALTRVLDHAANAFSSTSVVDVFSDAKRSAQRIDGLFLMLVCAERLNLENLNTQPRSPVSEADIKRAEALLDDLGKLRKAIDIANKGITADHLTYVTGTPCPAQATPDDVKLMWVVFMFHDMCVNYSNGMSTIGLLDPNAPPECKALRERTAKVMEDAFFHLATHYIAFSEVAAIRGSQSTHTAPPLVQ